MAAVRLLLEKGADAKLATRAGVNPLMIAAGLGTKEEDTTGRSKTEADTIETMTLLLDAGLDINAADNTGRTARTEPPCRDTIRWSGSWPSVARSWTSRTSGDSRRSTSRWDSPAAWDSTGEPAIRTKVPRRSCVN